MCKTINAESILKSYFRKYRYRKVIEYSRLNDYRQTIEQNADIYVDVSYSSFKSVEIKYGSRVITCGDTKIRLTKRKEFLTDRPSLLEQDYNIEQWL